MKKNKKNFYDSYDELFIKPKPTKETIKLKKQTVNKNKLFEEFGILLFLIGVVVFLAWVGGTSEKTTKEDTEEVEDVYKDIYEDDYKFIYPLKIDGITQVTNEEIDKSKPLYITLEDNTFNTNRGYQIEMPGEVDFSPLTRKDWAIVPDLREFSAKESDIYFDIYNKGSYVDTINMILYANIINGVELGLPKNNFIKVFPESPIDNIQRGKILKYDGNHGLDSIFQYYIFEDGTGITIQFSGGNKANDLPVEEDLTYDEFKELYKLDVEFLEKNIVFSKTEIEQ